MFVCLVMFISFFGFLLGCFFVYTNYYYFLVKQVMLTDIGDYMINQ